MERTDRRRFLAGTTAATISAAAGGVITSETARADVAPPGSVAYPVAGIAPPDQKITWKPATDRAAVLIHDMQHYFTKIFAADRQPYRQLITNIRRLLDAAHTAEIPVFYSGQPGGMTRAQRGLKHDFDGPGMPDDDTERAIVAPLAPSEPDTFITKWRDNAFLHTNLSQLLRWQKRDQLLVCGIYAFTGVTVTSADAFYHDIQPFILADAVADMTARGHSDALTWAAARTSRIMTTDTVLRAFRGT